MHFITATTLLFAACVAAQWDRGDQDFQSWQPRGGRSDRWGNDRGGNDRWGNDRWGNDPWGNRQQPPTDYRASCSCRTNEQQDPNVGRDACNQLSSIWGNLYWDEWQQTCRDNNNIGLDPNGFGAACQRAAQNQNRDSFNPVNAAADCSSW